MNLQRLAEWFEALEVTEDWDLRAAGYYDDEDGTTVIAYVMGREDA